MAMMVREVIVTMMVMREVMQPVEDELADDKLSASAGKIDRVIREGCPFLWGLKGYSSGGRWDLCWKKMFLLGRKGISVWWEGMSVREGGKSPSGGGKSLSGGGNLRLEGGNALSG